MGAADAIESEEQWQTSGGFTFVPATDGLWRNAPTPYRAIYAVLGVPLEFATNAPELAALADETFGYARSHDSRTAGAGLRLRVFLHDESESEGEFTPLLRSQESYLSIVSGNSVGFADRADGFAAAFVTPRAMRDQRFVQEAFIECLALYLAARHRPATLHAAGVVHNGRCALLTGGHGAGKSTLAYACLRADFRLLAEDVVFAEEREDAVYGWGHPLALHLLPDAVRLFPELRDQECVRQLNGESKLRVLADSCRGGGIVAQAPIHGILSIVRSDGASSRLRAANPESIHRALTEFEGDPILDRAAMDRIARRLAHGRIAHLDVGRDLAEAVRAIETWLDESCVPQNG